MHLEVLPTTKLCNSLPASHCSSQLACQLELMIARKLVLKGAQQSSTSRRNDMSHARKKSSFAIYQRWAVQNFIVQFVPMTCRSSFCVGVMWGNKDQQECLLQKQRGSSWNKEANAPSMRTSSQYIRETDAAFDLMQVPFQQLRPEFRRSFQASLSMWIWLKCSCWAENVFLEDTMPFRFESGPADTTPSSRAPFILHLLGFHWLTLRRSETFRSCSAAEDHPRQTSDFENQMALNDDAAAQGICLN